MATRLLEGFRAQQIVLRGSEHELRLSNIVVSDNFYATREAHECRIRRYSYVYMCMASQRVRACFVNVHGKPTHFFFAEATSSQ